MYTFPELIKKIRESAELTQAEFARALDVSTVLITMVETGQKDVSKNLITKLAKIMEVHPASITPFLFTDNSLSAKNISSTEKLFIKWGEEMQNFLIYDRSKKIKKYAK